MVKSFATIMCGVALYAGQAQAQKTWKAKNYKRGDLIKFKDQTFECKEWPMSEFCSIISPWEPHRDVAWREYDPDNPLPVDPEFQRCSVASFDKNIQYKKDDMVCFKGSEMVFRCKQETLCQSWDFVGANFIQDSFWEKWQLINKVADPVEDEGQDDEDEEEDDETNPDPEPNPDYWEVDRTLMPEDGCWTGNDWDDTENGFQIRNGVVIPSTEEAKSKIRSSSIVFPIPRVDANNSSSAPENVQRAIRVMSRDDWEYLVPLRLDFYTYDNFMQAMAAFPGICSDKGPGAQDLSIEEVCAKELAGLFAHFSQEVGAHWSGTDGIQEEWRQSLYLKSEEGCTSPNWWGDYCNYYPTWDEWSVRQNAYPRRDSSVSYHGRGPLQLSWNYQYGPFSKQLYGDQFILLDDPELFIKEGHGVEAFLAAFWFYVTPQNPKPSMHQVMTGLWQPNEQDLTQGNHAGFGATTNIINGAMECGYQNSQKANWRQEYYLGTADYFDVQIEDNEKTNCEQTNNFQQSGSANAQKNYWEQRWDGVQRCQLVTWMTPYSVYTEGDYKRCMEHFYP